MQRSQPFCVHSLKRSPESFSRKMILINWRCFKPTTRGARHAGGRQKPLFTSPFEMLKQAPSTHPDAWQWFCFYFAPFFNLMLNDDSAGVGMKARRCLGGILSRHRLKMKRDSHVDGAFSLRLLFLWSWIWITSGGARYGMSGRWGLVCFYARVKGVS